MALIPRPMPVSAAPPGAYMGAPVIPPAPDFLSKFKTGLKGSSNALLGYGLGVLSGAKGAELQGYMQGAQQDDAYATAKKAEAERAAAITATQQALSKYPDLAALAAVPGADPTPLINEMFKRMSPGYGQTAQVDQADTAAGRQKLAAEYGLDDDTAKHFILTGNLPGNNQSVRAGLGQPVVLINKATKEAMPFMPMSDGTYINPLTQQVADDQWEFDPAYLAQQRALGTAVGQGQGKAVTQAPQQITNGEMALGLIEEIRKHPELPWATGRGAAFGLNDPKWNPQRAAFQDLVEQSKSGAFLTAITQLQGMGALSNAEGAAATAAVNRINTAVEKDDFLKALADYEAMVKKGLARAQEILASQGLNEMGLPAQQGAPAVTAPGASPNVDALLEKYL